MFCIQDRYLCSHQPVYANLSTKKMPKKMATTTAMDKIPWGIRRNTKEKKYRFYLNRNVFVSHLYYEIFRMFCLLLHASILQDWHCYIFSCDSIRDAIRIYSLSSCFFSALNFAKLFRILYSGGIRFCSVIQSSPHSVSKRSCKNSHILNRIIWIHAAKSHKTHYV